MPAFYRPRKDEVIWFHGMLYVVRRILFLRRQVELIRVSKSGDKHVVRGVRVRHKLYDVKQDATYQEPFSPPSAN